jgi:glutathione S-transferase
MLTILGKLPSINVRKVTWTAGEIGLFYTREDWGIGFTSTATPEFLAKNPNGQVPVIECDDGILWESNTICRYLASRNERWDLLPQGAWERAQVERWMDWQATDLNGAWRYAFQGLCRKDPAFADPAQIEASLRQWNAKMGILETQLSATGAFVAGAQFTLADIGLALSANRWAKAPIDHPDYPAVMAYLDRTATRPAAEAHGHFTLG